MPGIKGRFHLRPILKNARNLLTNFSCQGFFLCSDHTLGKPDGVFLIYHKTGKEQDEAILI